MQRIKEYGFNEIPEKKRNPLVLFLKKFWGISAWMLELIIALSFMLRRFVDFFIVTILLIGNALISFAQDMLAFKAVESLRKKLHITSTVLRDGNWIALNARELVTDDIISVKSGDFVPADAVIISGSLSVDQSLLTGESLPQEKNTNDLVYSSSIVLTGEAICRITHTGAHTFFGKTIELVEEARPRSHSEETIAAITKRLFFIVAFFICLVFPLAINLHISLYEILPMMLILLLGAVPVALPAMFTVSMALGAQSLAKKGVLVSRLNAIEEAAHIDILCIDKTGTLTLNKLAVVAISPETSYHSSDVIGYGALASLPESLDPIDTAFRTAAHNAHINLSSYSIEQFIPFEAKTKYTEAVVKKEGKQIHIYKGALNAVLAQCKITSTEIEQTKRQELLFAEKGYRSIAVALTIDNVSHIVGLVALEDPLRPESKKVIDQLHNQGIVVKLLTGDSLAIAQHIASLIDLKETATSNSDPNQKTIFAQIFPEDKYTIVKALQKSGHIVGMMGDGVNDSPALQQAEVGIAVSNSTDVAKKAASIVLVKPGLTTVEELIVTGRLIFQRIHTWVLNKISRTVLKTGFFVVAFLATGRFVITASEMLLLIFMTDFVKISLATDNEKISKKPCTWQLFSLTFLGSALGIVMVIEALFLLFIGMNYLRVPETGLRTFCFEILFYMAVFSLFVVREEGHFWDSMPSKTLLISIALDMVVAFIIATYGLFGFEPLAVHFSLLIIAYACVFSLFFNDWIKVSLNLQRA